MIPVYSPDCPLCRADRNRALQDFAVQQFDTELGIPSSVYTQSTVEISQAQKVADQKKSELLAKQRQDKLRQKLGPFDRGQLPLPAKVDTTPISWEGNDPRVS